MITGRWTRRFWLLTLAALLSAGLTLRLGLWQLSRADQKQALQSEIAAQRALPPLDNLSLAALKPEAAPLHRRAVLRGRWMADATVFLDNRQMDGKPGFFVLTPLKLESSGTTVVVQRGWVQRSFVDRTQLPQLPSANGMVVVEGRIAPPPAKLYAFDGSERGRIRQNLDLPAFAQELGEALAGYSVLQSGPADAPLVRDWPAINTGVDKHYGYAFQWFALCALIVVLYVWFQIVRPVKSSRR